MAKYKTNNASALEHLDDIPDIPKTLGGLLTGTLVEDEGGVSSPTVDNKTAGEEGEQAAKLEKKEETPSSPVKKAKGSKTPAKSTKADKKDVVKGADVPTTLEGKDLWDQFVNMCDSDKGLRKDLGRGGTAKLMRIENDIVDTFSMCRVNDHSITTMVNAILRSFVLHYKKNFLEYKEEKHTTII